MKTLKLFLLLIIIVQPGFSQIWGVKDIKSISNMLDTTLYLNLTNFDTEKYVQLPDSVKQKVVNVLNGYLPPLVEKQLIQFNNKVIDNIVEEAKSICKSNNSSCIEQKKDSICKAMTANKRHVLQNTLNYPENFILAVGSWQVKEAIPILKNNINSNRYPYKETLMALAKMGDDSSLTVLQNQCTLDFIIRNTPLQIETNLTTYGDEINMTEIVNTFYRPGIYLRNKQILLNMIDLLDLKGRYYSSFSDTVMPIEEEVLLSFYILFVDINWFEWEKIIINYLTILDSKTLEQKEDMLTPSFKNDMKKELRVWIEKNVNF